MPTNNPALGQQSVYDGLRVTLTPAPFFHRLLAYCVDLGVLYGAISLLAILIFFFLAFIGVAVLGTLAALHGEHSEAALITGLTLFFIVLIVALALQDVYFIYFETKHGATLGKKLFGLRVIAIDGSAVSVGQATIRDLMRYFDCFLLVPALISILLNNQNRRLGDLMAGTVVVHSEARENSNRSLYLAYVDYEALRGRIPLPFIPRDAKVRFLGVAFPTLITKESSYEDLKVWEPWVNGFFTTTSPLGLSQEIRFRYVAEHCFQEQHQPDREVPR